LIATWDVLIERTGATADGFYGCHARRSGEVGNVIAAITRMDADDDQQLESAEKPASFERTFCNSLGPQKHGGWERGLFPAPDDKARGI